MARRSSGIAQGALSAPPGPVPAPGHQTSFAGGEVSPKLWFTSDLSKVRSGAARLYNMMVTPQGSARNRPGTQFVAQVRNIAQPPRIIPFQFSVSQTYILELDDHVIRFHSAGAPVLNGDGSPYEIASPYAIADVLQVKYTQSADVMTLTHPGYPPMNLSRLGQTNWVLSQITFAASLPPPSGVTATATEGSAGQINSTPKPTQLTFGYAVTAVSETNHDESVLSGPAATCTNYDLGYYSAYGTFNTINWSAVGGADYYNVYRIYQGGFGFIGSTVQTNFQDLNFQPDLASPPPLATNPFANGNNPSCVAYYQQRQVFGGSNQYPQTLWFSRSGAYNNMDVRQPARDDDPITLTIASQQVNQIKGFVAMSVGLVVMTGGGSWMVMGGGGSAVSAPPITPSQAVAAPQAFNTGSSDLQPIPIGYDILYVEEKQATVRDLAYNLYASAFTGTDITVLADHLFTGYQIKDWAYAHAPNKTLWVVRSDGALLGLTYLKEQEIWAWHQHQTAGNVVSVAVVSEQLDGVNEDVPYFVVQRAVNGVEQCYIERMHTRTLSGGDADIRYGWFVDCGLRYVGTPVTTVYGLSHLEGCTVNALADGRPVMGLVVRSGAVTLPAAASVVAVGLPYTSQVITVPFDGGQPTTLGRRRRITRMRIGVQNTIGLQIGADRSDWTRAQPLDDPTSTLMFTGVQTEMPPQSWDDYGQMMVQQIYPLPCTITSIIPDLTFGDEGIA